MECFSRWALFARRPLYIKKSESVDMDCEENNSEHSDED